MSTYHVRISGSTYGPFTPEQLQQLAASGRINGQAEVSRDRQTWAPAATVLGAALTRPASAPIPTPAPADMAMPKQEAKHYLEMLRNRTHYPFYRTTILICSILGYVLTALPIIGLVLKIVWTGLSSVEAIEVFGALFAAAFLGVFVTVSREMFSMYADFVDSTLAHHSKRS
jgi:hypothetical protein